MTQHLMPEHEIEDQQIMRRLAIVVGGFIIATAAMAIVIGAIMG